jgi:hypothetical protein
LRHKHEETKSKKKEENKTQRRKRRSKEETKSDTEKKYPSTRVNNCGNLSIESFMPVCRSPAPLIQSSAKHTYTQHTYIQEKKSGIESFISVCRSPAPSFSPLPSIHTHSIHTYKRKRAV